MSEQNQGATSLPPGEQPAKRKRGRPRKDDGLAQGRNSPVMPGSDGMRINQHVEVAPSDNNYDNMVGQVVSGVVEGSFDAGYFLTVRVGNTDTLLRGVVFQPGRFTPISEANDVAPQAKMYKRRSIPIPVLNPQTQVTSSITQSKQTNEQPIQFGNQAPVVPGLVIPSKLPSDTSYALGKQSASITVCSTVNLPKNVSGLSSGKNVIPQRTLGSELTSTQVPTSKIPSEPSYALDNQSVSDAVTVTDGLPKNDSGLSVLKNAIPQKTLGSDLSSTKILPSQLPSDPSSTLDKQSASDAVVVNDGQPKNESGLSFLKNVTPQKPLGSELPSTQVLPSKLPSDPSFALGKQAASDAITVTDGLRNKESGLSLLKNVIPQKTLGSELLSIQVLPSELPSDPLYALDKQAASDAVTVTDCLQKNDSGLPLLKNVILRKTSGSELPSDPSFALDKLSASDVVTMTDCLPKNDLGLSLGENVMPQQTLESELENKPVSQFEHDRIVERGKLPQEFDAPSLLGPQLDMEASKELKLDPASKTVVDIFPGNDTDQLIQVQHQAVGSGLKPSELIEAGLNSPNLELHLTSVVAEPKSVSPEQIDILMEKQDSSKNNILQDMELDLADNILRRDETSDNGGPVSDAADNIERVLQSAPKTNQPIMILPKEATPSEHERAAKGSVLPGMFKSKVSSSIDPTEDVDCVLKVAFPLTQSHGNPVVSNNPVGNGDSVQN